MTRTKELCQCGLVIFEKIGGGYFHEPSERRAWIDPATRDSFLKTHEARPMNEKELRALEQEARKNRAV